MKPTVIHLIEATELALQAIAKHKDKTLSEVVQEIVDEYLWLSKQELPKCIGMGKSGMSDLSERVDELLWQEGR
ncbi:hypothetical protein [Pseudanabaena sp. PCC 6802]|uniref:hypothetical protein n=1 Tax=Pseudanabaena sp. PCC 6802 TaxID=118173 RepID=UPI00034C2B6E|nr:hypothetical protein [Pseudanabaena sp. PCC 6802]